MMRNILVEHFGQVPVMAFLATPPLPFISTSFALDISCLALHLTQYPSIVMFLVKTVNRPLIDFSDPTLTQFPL